LTRISRFAVTADPNVADPNGETILLTVIQPASNHNAGDMHFGPDDLLYIPLGDGGTSPTAQNPATLLGKVVRIDVDGGAGTPPDCVGAGGGGYTVPATNPLVDGVGVGGCDEIWALGLRNPWRSSVDRATGDVWIADVGQNDWEEVNRQPAGSAGGDNYGWRCYEGNHDYDLSGCGPVGDYTFPLFEYSHASGCTVIGGYVYRGAQYPAMAGRYLLADYCSGNFWDLAPDGNNWVATPHTNLAMFGFVSFGEDADGELYVANITNGTIYHLQAN
jgi:glucose/arabinose dehydrogenase